MAPEVYAALRRSAARIERAFGNLSGGHKIGHSAELPAKDESSETAASSLNH